MAGALAENPGLAPPPGQPAASTATEPKRPNAISPSPAEILPTRILRVETPRLRPKTPDPCAPLRRSPDWLSEGFLSWPGLLLERSERFRTRTPGFSLET